MLHDELKQQKRACIANKNKVVICKNAKQRRRILGTLKNLNVPISIDTLNDKNIVFWPSLIITGGFIYGYKKLEYNYSNTTYTEVSEKEFIDLFIIKKFDIYGNDISNV